MAQPPVTTFEAKPPPNRTFARQGELPKLPIPPLEETLKRYLNALVGLQDPHEHARTRAAVDDFLKGEGPRIQERLIEWAKTKDR
jgi:carnitine O-acetyltransferase